MFQFEFVYQNERISFTLHDLFMSTLSLVFRQINLLYESLQDRVTTFFDPINQNEDHLKNG